jgi:hypothetical protein
MVATPFKHLRLTVPIGRSSKPVPVDAIRKNRLQFMKNALSFLLGLWATFSWNLQPILAAAAAPATIPAAKSPSAPAPIAPTAPIPSPTNTPAANPATVTAATAVPPPAAPAKRSAAELEKLAVPIALHPDPLISIILPAAVYPVEIVMAARFVKDTNNIAKLETQPWDENVKAVAKFPDLIAKMDQDLDWTIALGQAFLEQRKELMDTIQSLRLKAQTAGTLQTSPQQVVTVTNSVVETIVEQHTVVVTNTIVQIQPSNPEVIYVPSYPPTVYYPPPATYGYPSYYGYGYYPYAPLVTFGVGMAWGAAISHWNHCDWHGGDVDIDIDNDINIDRGDRNTNIRGGDRTNVRGGDRASNTGRSWQPDQNRLRNSGAPTAKTREATARGWNPSASGTGRPSQFSSGAGGTRGVGQQNPGGANLGAAQRPAAATRPQAQPSRSPSVSQRPATTQRPASSASNYRSSNASRSSAFGGINNGGGSTRSYSNRGSYSRGSGGFSGGGGARGGGRGGGGRR